MSCRSSLAVAIVLLATAVTVVAVDDAARATHPGENGRIAYVAYDGVLGVEIFSAKPDGSDVFQVTDLGVGVGHPEWSPDGQRIVFDIGTDGPTGCILSDLWVVNADGSGLTQITDTPDLTEYDASWSPDGSELVFTQLTQFGGCNGTGSDTDLWVIGADGTNRVKITDGPPNESWHDTEPAWSPLGNRIAFVSDRPNADGSTIREIFTVAPDGSGVVKLTDFTVEDFAEQGHPSWSPDGQQIVHEKFWFGTAASEIWVMNADGSDKHAVTQNLDDVNPSWSPDGTKITFMGIQAGGGNWVFIINTDGTERHVVADAGAAAWPTWQPIVAPPPPPPSDDVVIDDCDDPALASLTTVAGDLIAIDVEDCAAISLPELKEVGGTLVVALNSEATAVDMSALTTVGGTLDVSGNTAAAVIDMSALTTVGGTLDVSGNTAAAVIDMSALTTVGGTLDVSGNTAAAVIDMSALTTVGGTLDVSGNTAAAVIDMSALTTVGGTLDVSGNTAVAVIDMSALTDVGGSINVAGNGTASVSAITAGGATVVSMSGPTATMHVTLSEGSYAEPVAFSIVRIGADGLGAQAGTAADGTDATIDPVEGYAFEFAVPELGVPATLTFEVDVAGLDEATRQTLLEAIAADNATLATRGDAEGSSYTAFALCAAGESPADDGCVQLEVLDEFGLPTTGEPALVRFSSVVGHFSSWVVAIVEPEPDDITPPVLDTPADLVAEAIGPDGATVTYDTPSGVDDVDGVVAVQCTPQSGSTFSLGSTSVACAATDAAGNLGTTGFEVIVEDSVAPTISAPADITTMATGPSGAVVAFGATTTDTVDGDGIATCTPSSGSMFPIGANTVTCSASDAAGNESPTSMFVVTVLPQTAPPAAPDVSVAAGWGAATVTWQWPAGGGSAATGFLITATANGRTVASTSVGPTVASHTFGGLTNGVAHTFVVTAQSDAGSGPEGTAVATPTAPRYSSPIDVTAVCPSFAAHNPNPYPVHVWWVTTRGQVGESAIPAGATKPLASARWLTAIVVVAGVSRVQDAAIGTC